jgi:alkanesulfonate monooxygenase SsuD/methylene tetrahydromethanopterin reductase-like flavin-dependent oxidoreductase (luciferase family)
VVTLDRVSNGRVTLGAGTGWLEEEFVAADQQFAARGRRMNEIIDILRRLWTEEVIAHEGEFYSFAPVKFAPKPVQKPSIPIEVGGHGPPALRRAGRLGDGWVEVGAKDFATLEERLAVVMAARQEAGRTGPFEVTSHLGFGLDDIKQCAELGVTRLVVGPRKDPGFTPKDPTRLHKDDFTNWCKRYADEVIANA